MRNASERALKRVKVLIAGKLTSALKLQHIAIKLNYFKTPILEGMPTNAGAIESNRDMATERKHLTCNYHHADGEYLLVISLGSDVSKSDL